MLKFVNGKIVAFFDLMAPLLLQFVLPVGTMVVKLKATQLKYFNGKLNSCFLRKKIENLIGKFLK